MFLRADEKVLKSFIKKHRKGHELFVDSDFQSVRRLDYVSVGAQLFILEEKGLIRDVSRDNVLAYVLTESGKSYFKEKRRRIVLACVDKILLTVLVGLTVMFLWHYVDLFVFNNVPVNKP